MKNIFRFISTGILIMVLSGCGAPSVEELKNDRALFAETLADCQLMTPSESMEDEACVNVAQAASAHGMSDINNMMKGLMGN